MKNKFPRDYILEDMNKFYLFYEHTFDTGKELQNYFLEPLQGSPFSGSREVCKEILNDLDWDNILAEFKRSK